MKVTIFGTGYVGLVTGACLANVGHDVVCVDIDADKVAGLNQGQIPIFEPGRDAMDKANHAAGRLHFTIGGAGAIAHGEPIKVFNHGYHKRSFTYIDDIVEGVVRVLDKLPARDPAWNGRTPAPGSRGVAPYRIHNIGNEQPVELLRYIEVLEECLGKKAKMEKLPLQAGDVPDTEADVPGLFGTVGYTPRVQQENGLAEFVGWYRAIYAGQSYAGQSGRL